jgi:hypothetical protein
MKEIQKEKKKKEIREDENWRNIPCSQVRRQDIKGIDSAKID